MGLSANIDSSRTIGSTEMQFILISINHSIRFKILSTRQLDRKVDHINSMITKKLKIQINKNSVPMLIYQMKKTEVNFAQIGILPEPELLVIFF